MRLIILFLTSLFFITSCQVIDAFKKPPEPEKSEKKEWTPVEQIDQVVWADDGSEVAVVKLHFEKKTEKRYFKHQIFIQKINDKEKLPLTELRDHQVGQVFFMRSANYLIVESILPEKTRRFDKVDMKGHEILIIEIANEVSCQSQQNSSTETKPPPIVHHTVIPSPDGRQLAHVFSPECKKASVEFLSADDLTVIDNQTFDIDEPMEVTWHRDGYIIFSTPKRDKAWQVKVKEMPLPIPPPQCLSPVTTSSHVSTEGRLVYVDENGKLATREVERQKTFGCQ